MNQLERANAAWCETFATTVPSWGYLRTVSVRLREWQWPPRRRYPYDWAVQGI